MTFRLEGYYLLRAWCENRHEPWHHFDDGYRALMEVEHPSGRGTCVREMRKQGWLIAQHRGIVSRVLCPKCKKERHPTPWCHVCGAVAKAGCTCGPIAENE